jgi:pilus assembly protein CpaF
MTETYRANMLILSDPRLLKLKEYLINAVSPEMQNQSSAKQQGRDAVRRLLLEAFKHTQADLKPEVRDHIVDSALADLVGYGPLELLLPDPEISEIMVNGAKNVFVERNGEVLETDIQFDDDEHLLRIIDRIVSPLGRRVDSDNPPPTPACRTARASTSSSRPSPWTVRISPSVNSCRRK